MPSDHDNTSSILFDLVDMLERDRHSGSLRGLVHYLARFRGHEEEVAREYLKLLGTPPPSPPLPSPPEPNAPLAESAPPQDDSMAGFLKSSGTPFAEHLQRLAAPVLRGARFRREDVIARGGMGVIHRARDLELDRTLALKEMILGPADQHTLAAARFLEEAQVTAQLDHPGIVPIHDVGMDAEGRLFFAMKLVNGRNLRHVFALVFQEQEGWNETRALSVILRVCEAMSYAHAKGVIHRDLKPANVMVGSFGEVYVMDWGLARVLGRKDAHDLRLAPEFEHTSSLRTVRADERGEAPDSPLLTMDGAIVGTPAYMPPEQARGEIEKLSPRADVYALGAMLYHLLARHLPYAEPGVRISNHAMLARVLDGPPKALSKIRVGIPLELVAICEKAMARDAQARYMSTLELAEDLRAFLEHRVVGAYEMGTWAETKKWVQRNKALSGVIGAALVVALGGAIAFSIKAEEAEASAQLANELTNLATTRASELAQAVELAEENARTAESRRQEAEAARADALKQRDAADRNAAETKEVADFQSKMLSDLSVDEFGHMIVVELEKDLGENLTRLGKDAQEIEQAESDLSALLGSTNPTNVAQRVLERAIFDPAVRTVEKDYADRPLLAAMLETPLAETLNSLGLYELGERAGQAAVAARRAELGDEHPDTLHSIHSRACLLYYQGKFSEAEPLFREALTGLRKELGDEHPETLVSIHNLALLLRGQGKFAEAESLFREALEGQRKTLGDEHLDALASIHNLALLLQDQGRLTEAEPLAREALEGRRKKLGDEHPNTLDSINSRARLLYFRGKSTEAEQLFREALAGYRTKLGDEHPKTLVSINNLAMLLKDQGKLTEAEPLLREALAGDRKKLGDEHPGTLTSINNFAILLTDQGKLTEAEPLFREALAGRSAKLGDDHPDTLTSISNLAFILKAQGKLTEAEPLLREALAGCRTKLGDEHPDTLVKINNLALLLQAQSRLSEAEPLLREALAGYRKKFGDEHPETFTSLNNLAMLLQARGRFTEAEPLLREALAGQRTKLGDEHPHTLTSINNLALLLQDQGKLTEAEALFRKALEGRRAKLGDRHPATQKTVTSLISLYGTLQSQDAGHGYGTQAAELRKLLKQ